MAAPAKKTIDPKKQREKDRKLLLKPCKTPEELKKWIRYFLNLELPDVLVSRYASSTPFDAVWEQYKICVLKQNPDNIQELLYTASRGAGKTLSTAIAEFLIMLHDKRDVAHVGAIMAQAKRCYEYQQSFYLNPRIRAVIDPPDEKEFEKILQKNTMEKSVFNIDGETCALEVLPCTMKSCNSIHSPYVGCDELDTLSGEGLRAFKEISGMLDTKKGKKPLRVGISTRKSTFGLMHRMIENADKEGRHLRFWTALEFTERCPDERSGTEQVPLYINPSKGEVLTKEDWQRKDLQKQKEYEMEMMYDKCVKCPVASYCRGDAKKQTSKSPMLKTIDEMNKKVLSEGHDWAASQLFNLKPSLEGIIFREYDAKDHVKKWNEMWKLLTGKDFPGDCTHDIFVKKCNEMGLPCYGGLDFGWSNPSTIVYMYVDPRDNIYVVRAEGNTFVNDPTWIHYVNLKYHRMYRCQLYFPDIANGSAVDLMKAAGLPVCDKYDKSINLGIQVIKRFLRTPGTGDPKIFWAAETTKPMQEEFTKYHYKTDAAGLVTDDPDDANNHYVDPLRYMMTMLFGKASTTLANMSDLQMDPALDHNGNYKRTPSPAEFAAAQGMIFNDNMNEINNLGKVGKLSDLEDGGKNTQEAGDGFMWWSDD